MNVKRKLSKSRLGHWHIVLIDVDSGRRAWGQPAPSRQHALAQEDDLMDNLRARARDVGRPAAKL